ncbi:FAD:protein FMN transferase, partial [Faecalibacillus intestinalis]|uniref:FAD:protein FMN transferase n=1 Tax=Faecalibacillus intestinalis TaxID=1982626 RepID=UPI002FDB05E5
IVTSVRIKDDCNKCTYQRYIEINSKKYHHILNPSTGYCYDNDLSSVTIVSKSSLQGDALSTVCFALGKEKGLALLNSIKNVSGCFIDDHNQISYSKNFKKYLSN